MNHSLIALAESYLRLRHLSEVASHVRAQNSHHQQLATRLQISRGEIHEDVRLILSQHLSIAIHTIRKVLALTLHDMLIDQY